MAINLSQVLNGYTAPAFQATFSPEPEVRQSAAQRFQAALPCLIHPEIAVYPEDGGIRWIVCDVEFMPETLGTKPHHRYFGSGVVFNGYGAEYRARYHAMMMQYVRDVAKLQGR